jgi:hypothetical protein
MMTDAEIDQAIGSINENYPIWQAILAMLQRDIESATSDVSVPGFPTMYANTKQEGSPTHWKSTLVSKSECERLKQERLKALERLPELVRRREVLEIMQWGVRTYYRVSKHHRIRSYAYREEGRVPKAVLRVWIMESDLM